MSAAASPYAKRIVRALLDDLTSFPDLVPEWDFANARSRAEIETEWCRLVDEELKGSLL